MLRFLLLLFPVWAFCINAPEYMSSHIHTYEYESGDLIHQSEGTLMAAQNVGLKFEHSNESYYLFNSKIYRYQKRLNQVIIYDQMPDVVKSISWIISPNAISNSYLISETESKTFLQSYSGNESIEIEYDNRKIPVKASWSKDDRTFMVTFDHVKTRPFAHDDVKPQFSKDTDIINFGDQYE
jgi:hypothetical protein